MRRQRSHWAVLLVALAGFVLTFCAFYPGLMSPDSSYQLNQARRFRFADGHPVAMALIWAGTIQLSRGPRGFFLLLLLLYWGGFFLVSRCFVERSQPGLWAAAAVPFLPFVINFSGTLWKDARVRLLPRRVRHRPPLCPFIEEVTRESIEYGFTGNVLFRSLRTAILDIAATRPWTMFFTQAFWFLAAPVVFLLHLFYRGRHPAATDPGLIASASAALYTAPLAIVGLAHDFR
jgi:hypothetical protein